MAVSADCVAKAYYIFLPLLILAKVFHLSKGKKINGTFLKVGWSMEYDEAYGWVNLPYDDYQFTFHSSGNVMKKRYDSWGEDH